jgi:tetratricopeptide (TPR) repeat protein
MLNKKLIVVVVLTLLFAGGLIGGLFVLQQRSNVQRHLDLGDRLMAEGNPREAHQAYGRAVNKDPANLQYLDLFEQTLLATKPESRDDARQLYHKWLAILGQRVRYHRQDPAQHRRLLDVLLFPARLTGDPAWWERVADAARDMEDGLAPDDPAAVDTKLYRAVATFAQMLTREPELLSPTEERLGITAELKAELDLLAYLEVNPGSDEGWANLARGQLMMSQKLRTERQETRADAWLDKAGRTLDRAMESVVDGPRLARELVRYRAVRLVRDPESVRQEQLEQAVHRAVELARASENEVLVADMAEILRTLAWLGYMPDAVDLLVTFVARHPESLLHRWMLGRYYFIDRQLDLAEAEARTVIEAPLLPVGFVSLFQDQLQKRCAALLVDVAHRRWETATQAERPAALIKVDEAMKELEGHITDPAADVVYLLAEGKVALAHEDYRTAAARFDNLARRPDTVTAEVLTYAAFALEKIDSVGLAYERLQQLVSEQPSNTNGLYECARLALQLRNLDDARKWKDKLLEIDPNHALGRQIATLIATEAGGTDAAGASVDPVAQALLDARSALQSGSIDTARATLLNLLSSDPDNLQALDLILQVELAANATDQAIAYVERLLALQPQNARLRQLHVTLRSSDPHDRIRQYVASLGIDAGQQSVVLTISFAALAGTEEARAATLRRAGSTAEADAAEEAARLAREQMEQALAEAIRLAPDDLQLLDFRFRRALVRSDWTEAETLARSAERLNADMAGGSLYAGVLALARGERAEAVRLLEQATARAPFASEAWRSLAIAFEQMGNFGRAKETYQQAYFINPNDADTVRRYVQLLGQVGDDDRALRVLRSARRLLPGDLRLREAWLALEIKAGDKAVALATRREIASTVPNDVMNVAQLATFLATAEPVREIMLDEQGAQRYPESRWLRMTAAEKQGAVEETKVQWHAECDAILARLEAQAPEDLEVASLRALLLRERGQIDAGEEVLNAFLKRSPEDPQRLVALALYLHHVGRAERAFALLEGARRFQSAGDPVVDRALADLHFRSGRVNEALTAYERVAAATGEDEAALHAIECLEKLGRFTDAQRRLQERMDRGQQGYLEQMLSATVADGFANQLIVEGKPRESETQLARRDAALQRAAELNPSSPQPHVQRALALFRAFQRQLQTAGVEQAANLRRQSPLLTEALRALDRADEIRPGHTQTSLARVAILQAREDTAGAVAELDRLLARAPDEHQARRLVVQLHFASGNMNAAVTALQKGVARNPTLPDWHELLGEVHLLQLRGLKSQPTPGDPELQALARKALESFAHATRLGPTPNRVRKVVTVYFMMQPPDHAAAAKVLADNPAMLAADGALRSVYALALNGQGKKAAALEELKAAHAQLRAAPEADGLVGLSEWFDAAERVFVQQPQELEAFVAGLAPGEPDAITLRLLARHWAGMGEAGISRALELHERAIARSAGAERHVLADMHYDLARYLILAQRHEDAAVALHKVLEMVPDHLLGLNNLTYLLATDLGRPAEARAMVEKLSGLIAPTLPPAIQATLLDTVGWVYYRLGELPTAETFLRRAVEVAETAANRYHLAQALADGGRRDAAEVHLQRATQLEPDEETSQQINRLFDDIRTGRGRR